MRFAILGASSFTGVNLVAYLRECGDEVLELGRSYDINRDIPEMVRVLREWKPKHIVNLIAKGRVPESWGKPACWMQTNVTAHVALHDQLRHCDFIEKYVHVSTPEVYGNTPGWVTEDCPFNPSTPYAVSKAACEMSLQTFRNAYGFPVAFTRSANVYGPGQRNRLIPNAVYAKQAGTKLSLEGNAVRGYVHIRDVASATRLVAEKGVIGEAYHIATREIHSTKEIAESVGCEYETVPARMAQDRIYALLTDKIRRLGWTDTVSLQSGINEMEAHGYRDRPVAMA